MTSPTSAAVAMAAAVHATPGITRAEAARELDIPSGFAAEVAARLVAAEVLEERAGAPTGRRGRPSTALWPHPAGPLVAVAAVSHETWDVATVQLGGSEVVHRSGPHGRDPGTLDEVAAQLGRLAQRVGPRIQAVVVAVPGTVTADRLVQAPNLGWRDVDLRALLPRRVAGAVFVAGNDATFAGVAEHRRGAATGASVAVHLFVDAGVGGVLIDGGRPVLGARGTAGEFGHMPFGAAGRRCQCGAVGCWNTALDGDALARALGAPSPADQVTYSRTVLAAAQGGDAPAGRAVRAVARSLGRGAAALVNALDPDVVTIGGLGGDLLAAAGAEVAGAYRRGLMGFRASDPPPLLRARFGGEGPRIGAAEEGFARILTDDGLARWAERAGTGRR